MWIPDFEDFMASRAKSCINLAGVKFGRGALAQNLEMAVSESGKLQPPELVEPNVARLAAKVCFGFSSISFGQGVPSF